ncbi:MAG: ABC transporter permease [Fibrobacter sp.]|jgi:ABC-type transport system involved in multi-copper enzyme maturation permease subunit|nr:ABC transporter permease [Fibrobacter sp.]
MMFHIVKHEMRLIFREPRFWVPFFLPPLLLLISLGILLFQGSSVLLGSSLYSLALLSGVLTVPMVIPLIADSFAGERERHSLELLLLLPVPRSQLFLGKILAVLPFPFLFSFLIQCLFLIFFPGFSFDIFWKSLVGVAAACFLISAVSLMISLSAGSAKAATQGAFLCVIPLFFLAQWGGEYYFHSLPSLFAFGFFIVCLIFFLVYISFAYRKFSYR